MESALKKLPAIVLALAMTAPAFGDEDDDDDGDRRGRHAPKVKFQNNREHYKYELRDDRCKYKYEYNYRSGKTKVEEQGDCRHVVTARPVAHGEPLPRAVPPEPQAQTIECNREVLGAILGGAIGAGVGSRVGDRDTRAITTVGGAVIGAVVGGAIGRSMDEADQACAAQALEYAQLRQSVTWKNPARAASYSITSTELVRSDRGAECRKYVLRANTGGRQQNHMATACRQSNGAWNLVS